MFTVNSKIFDLSPNFRKLGVDKKDTDTQVCLSQPDFLMNSHGFILNDISALTAAQNAHEAELLLKRIQLYQANNPDTVNMSVTDLIRTVSPRSAQCPSEIVRAAEYIGAALQEKVDSKVAAKVAKAQSKAEKEPAANKPAPQYSEGSTT